MEANLLEIAFALLKYQWVCVFFHLKAKFRYKEEIPAHYAILE